MSPAEQDASRPGFGPWLRGALLIALVAAVYAPTLWNGYVSDDEIYILGTRELGTLGGLRDIWFHIGAIPQYYPLVHTSFWLEYHLWGLAPVGFHAMNLAAHATVVVLAWRLLLRLGVPGAWFAAAVFAVHPVHVETVAWASERKNLFSMSFALASIGAYLRFSPLGAEPPAPVASANRRWYLLALVFYVAALLCKTVTVATPAVLGVLQWWKTGSLRWRDVRPLLPFLALGLPLSLLTIWIERVHVGATGAAWQLGMLERSLIAGRAVWFYLGKLVWPHPLGFVYPRWDVDPAVAWQWTFPIALVAVMIAAFVLRHRLGRGPLAALLLFVGILFPALGFFDVYPFLFSYVADHYQYHASLAPIALVAATLAIATQRTHGFPRSALLGAALVGIAALALIAQRETRFYRDDATLIRRSAETQPDSWAARYRLGAVLQNEGRNEAAVEEMRVALQLFPTHAPIRAGIATNLAALGRFEEAASELEAALTGDLDDEQIVLAHLQLGNVRVAQRRLDAAAAHFLTATTLAPDSAEAQYSLGLVLHRLGDATGSLAALRRSIALDPQAAKSHYALGTVLLESGNAPGAMEPLRNAVRLTPDAPGFRERLAAASARVTAGPEPPGD